MKQTGKGPEEMTDQDALRQDLLDLERRGWDALCSVNGARFYDDLMTEDPLMVFPGTVMTKRESVAAITAERPWTDYRIEDARVLPVGDRGAIVTYRAIASRPERPMYEALMTSVYSRHGDAWKLSLHQQTPFVRRPSPPPER